MMMYICVCSDQDPAQLIRCIDFRYITDALTEQEALGEIITSELLF